MTMQRTLAVIVVLLAARLPVQAAPTPDAHYPFSGDANDASGNGHHATVYGATLCPDGSGVANSAYSLDGNDYIAAPTSPTVTTSATFATWVYMNPGGEVGYIMNKGTYLVPETYSLTINRPTPEAFPRLQARVNAGGVYYWATSDEELLEEVWTHVAGVYDGDGSGLTLYVNGHPVANTPAPGSLDQNTEPLVFGGDVGNPGSFIEGRIDEVRIYDEALTQSQVMALVPEPVTLSLLALAVGAVMRRRSAGVK
jgi:hypothetical protein